MIAVLIIFGIIGLWLFGFFTGRNNPNIAAVNNLLAKGKHAYDIVSKTFKKL